MICSKCGCQQPDSSLSSIKSLVCPICGAEFTPETKEGWMRYSYLKQSEDNVQNNPNAQKITDFNIIKIENIEEDGYGRTYAEVTIRAATANDTVNANMAVCFLDVTDHAPCQVVLPTILLIPGLFVESQKKKAKKKFEMGKPRK